MSDTPRPSRRPGSRRRRSAARDPPRHDHCRRCSSCCSSAGRRSCRSMRASMPRARSRSPGNRQSVQHRDGGVVTAIHVREGQHVARRRRAGRIVGARAQGVRAGADQRLSDLARPAGAAACRADRTTRLRAAARIRVVEPGRPRDRRQVMAMQRSEMFARSGSISAQQSVLGQRAGSWSQQQSGYGKQRESLIEQQRLIAEELDGLKSIAAKGFASINRVRAARAGAGGAQGPGSADGRRICPGGRGHWRNPDAIAER